MCFHDKPAEIGQHFSHNRDPIAQFSVGHLEALTSLFHIAASLNIKEVNIIVFADNAGAVISLAKQCSSDPSLAAVAHLTWKSLSARGVTAWFAYVNARRNPADDASRLD